MSTDNYDKIILIASRKYTSNQIQQYNKLDYSNACIATFNIISQDQEKLFEGKYQYRFLRGIGSLIGKNGKIKGHVNVDATFYICRELDVIKKANNLKKTVKLDVVPYRSQLNKYPSLGYIAYNILSKKYTDIPIYLVGFTFMPGNKWHDGKQEKQIITKDKRVHII